MRKFLTETCRLHARFIQVRCLDKRSVSNLPDFQLISLSEVEKARGRSRDIGLQVEGQPIAQACVVRGGALRRFSGR